MKSFSLSLLGGFEMDHAGEEILLPLASQRLLALLALEDRGIHRSSGAERLWPACTRHRAAANLRSALWQVRRIGERAIIESAGPRLVLSAAVMVDVRLLVDQARSITSPAIQAADSARRHDVITGLSRELLPDWADDWLLLERERWDQVRLHALEAVARELMDQERYLPALEAALAAVAIEPVRESAHRTVVEVYLAEGNTACAIKHFHRYRSLVQRELGVGPSRRMLELINVS